MPITKCPHCHDNAIIRDSTQQSDLVRSAVGVCKNPFCGHTFHVTISIDYTLSPAAIPNPSINLPVSPRAKAQTQTSLDL